MMTLFGDDPAPVPEELDTDWMEFRRLYPRKEKWVDGRKAWTQLKPSHTLALQIIEDVKLRTLNNWHGKEKRYLPLPASYLREHRWTDEIYKNRDSHGANKELHGKNHGRFSKFVRGGEPDGSPA